MTCVLHIGPVIFSLILIVYFALNAFSSATRRALLATFAVSRSTAMACSRDPLANERRQNVVAPPSNHGKRRTAKVASNVAQDTVLMK